MSNLLLAVAVAVGIVLSHLWQVDMLAGSIGEYWKRTDMRARSSKIFFGLSLCSCIFILLWPTVGIFFVVALLAVSAGLSMNEWKS
jgi:hypothetical protein